MKVRVELVLAADYELGNIPEGEQASATRKLEETIREAPEGFLHQLWERHKAAMNGATEDSSVFTFVVRNLEKTK